MFVNLQTSPVLFPTMNHCRKFPFCHFRPRSSCTTSKFFLLACNTASKAPARLHRPDASSTWVTHYTHHAEFQRSGRRPRVE
jgi:hypothetical protein